MTFWDSSALVPLFAAESRTPSMQSPDHHLRVARVPDALQLAAAVVAAERRPSTLAFVTCDGRPQDAAVKEGFLIE